VIVVFVVFCALFGRPVLTISTDCTVRLFSPSTATSNLPRQNTSTLSLDPHGHGRGSTGVNTSRTDADVEFVGRTPQSSDALIRYVAENPSLVILAFDQSSRHYTLVRRIPMASTASSVPNTVSVPIVAPSVLDQRVPVCTPFEAWFDPKVAALRAVQQKQQQQLQSLSSDNTALHTVIADGTDMSFALSDDNMVNNENDDLSTDVVVQPQPSPLQHHAGWVSPTTTTRPSPLALSPLPVKKRRGRPPRKSVCDEQEKESRLDKQTRTETERSIKGAASSSIQKKHTPPDAVLDDSRRPANTAQKKKNNALLLATRRPKTRRAKLRCLDAMKLCVRMDAAGAHDDAMSSSYSSHDDGDDDDDDTSNSDASDVELDSVSSVHASQKTTVRCKDKPPSSARQQLCSTPIRKRKRQIPYADASGDEMVGHRIPEISDAVIISEQHGYISEDESVTKRRKKTVVNRDNVATVTASSNTTNATVVSNNQQKSNNASLSTTTNFGLIPLQDKVAARTAFDYFCMTPNATAGVAFAQGLFADVRHLAQRDLTYERDQKKIEASIDALNATITQLASDQKMIQRDLAQLLLRKR